MVVVDFLGIFTVIRILCGILAASFIVANITIGMVLRAISPDLTRRSEDALRRVHIKLAIITGIFGIVLGIFTLIGAVVTGG